MPSAGKTVLVLYLLALAVRLLAVWEYGREGQLGVDQTEYLVLAQNLRLHGAFSYGAPHKWGETPALDSAGPFLPTAARAPLFPVVIAALWWGEAPPVGAVFLLNAVLGAFVPVFVYLMALRAFGHRAALIAGLAMAAAPQSANLTAILLSDTLFCFLLTGGLFLWDRQHGWLAGLAFGAAMLTRAVLLPVLLLIGLMAIVLKANRRTHAAIALGALVVVAPWTLRNAVTQHAFVPVSTMGWGANVLLGTREVPYGSGNPFLTYIKDGDFTGIIARAPTEAEAEGLMFREGLRRIVEAPGHWLWIRVTQYPRLFFEGPAFLYELLPALPTGLIKFTYLAGVALFVGFSLAGLWLARARWRELYHLALFPVCLAGIYFVGAVEDRYSLSMFPMMAIFAGHALSRLSDPSADRSRRRGW